MVSNDKADPLGNRSCSTGSIAPWGAEVFDMSEDSIFEKEFRSGMIRLLQSLKLLRADSREWKIKLLAGHTPAKMNLPSSPIFGHIPPAAF